MSVTNAVATATGTGSVHRPAAAHLPRDRAARHPAPGHRRLRPSQPGQTFLPPHRSQATRLPNTSVTTGTVGSAHAGQVPAPRQSGQAGGSDPHWTHRAALDGVRALHDGQVTSGTGRSDGRWPRGRHAASRLAVA